MRECMGVVRSIPNHHQKFFVSVGLNKLLIPSINLKHHVKNTSTTKEETRRKCRQRI